MDGKATATDAISHHFSDSTGSSLFHPSNDSVVDSSLENYALDADNNKSSADEKSSSGSSSGSSSSSSSSDGGFVSGEEDFETASERPGMGDADEETLEKPIEGDDIDDPFVDSPEVLVAKDFSPIDIPAFDDDENDVVGDSEMGDWKNSDAVDGGKGLEVDRDDGIVMKTEIGDISGEEKGVTVEKEKVEDKNPHGLVEGTKRSFEVNKIEGLVGQESAIAGKINKKSNGVMEENVIVDNKNESVDDVLVETDGREFASGGEDKGVLVEMGERENDNLELVLEKMMVEGTELKKNGGAVEGNKSENFDGSESIWSGKTNEEINGVAVGEENMKACDENGLVGDKLVEAEGMKFTSVGDSVVSALDVDLVGSGAAVVVDVKGHNDFESSAAIQGDRRVTLEDEYNQISSDTEELVGSGAEFDKNVEQITGGGAPEIEADGEKPDVTDLCQNEHAGFINNDGAVEANRSENFDGKESLPSGKTNEENSGVAEGEENMKACDEKGLADDKLVEADGMTFPSAGDSVVEALDVEADGENADIIDLGQNENLYVGHVAHNTVVESKDLTAKVEVSIDDSGNLEFINNDEKLVAEAKQEVDFEAKPSEVDTVSKTKVGLDAEDERKYHHDEEGEIGGSDTDEETEGLVYGSSEVAKRFLEELERGSIGGSHSGAESSHGHSQRIDGQIITDSDEVDTDDEGEGKELYDSAALAALLKAATGASSDGGNITITSRDGSRLFSVERPAGLGFSTRSMRPAPQSNRPDVFAPASRVTGGSTEIDLSEEDKKIPEKLQQIRVKFLRLAQRLGHSAEDSIVSRVLNELAFVAVQHNGELFSLETAKKIATQVEMEGKDDLNFSLNILVLGKSGVGKSATINAIFGQEKALIHAFEPATTSVKELSGIVDGVHIRVIDTPGLKSSAIEQGANRKVLSVIKKFTKKFPPDIVLYVDRLDAQTWDLNDLPLIKTITASLGSSIWQNAIVALTHASSAPPDGPSGSPLSYEVFVDQRSRVVQHSIRQALSDLRLMNPSLMYRVQLQLVENHLSCRKNRDGQKVLPNGQAWRPQLLMLCYSTKIFSEASTLSKPQDPLHQRKLFGFRVRPPPLPYLLSLLLQSRTHPRLSTDQGVDNVDSDIDMADLSDSDQEEEEKEDDEYDQLPPFKPLRKAQIAKLSREQKKAYFEEYDYRVKLLQKKQWREQLKQMREMKKRGKTPVDEYGYTGEDDSENRGPATVPVPSPDRVLPPSFDGDNPAFRYRSLEQASQFRAFPAVDSQGWDHDCGYDGVNVEHSLAIANQFPGAITVQVKKDKKEFNIHLDSSISAKHGENGSTMAGVDIQNVGRQLAYILRGETKFKIFKKNKTTAGASVTFLGENVATGIKLEDQIALGKRLMLVGSTGTVRSQSDAVYGANLEVRLREADFPIGQDQSALGFSLVKGRGDLAMGANLHSQFSVGRSSKIAVQAGLNNKLSGQISVRTSSSDQLQIALVGLLPIAMAIYKSIRHGVSDNYSFY